MMNTDPELEFNIQLERNSTASNSQNEPSNKSAD